MKPNNSHYGNWFGVKPDIWWDRPNFDLNDHIKLIFKNGKLIRAFRIKR